MKAFQVDVGGKVLDYRKSEELDLAEVNRFFSKDYSVTKLIQGGRHVTGILERDKQKFFLKLATTEGVSAISQTEFVWNDQFNKHVPRTSSDFWVPMNKKSGMYNKNLFYLITDMFEGELLAERPKKGNLVSSFASHIPQIIDFTDLIQELPIAPLSTRDEPDYQRFFLQKTEAWHEEIPEDVKNVYETNKLLSIVHETYQNLTHGTRHGDFTPWHLMLLSNGKFGLLDGEHAMRHGVQYYDIAYFIQRLFSVLEEPSFAEQILNMLRERNYNISMLRTVMATRGIGGFLDESLTHLPDYAIHKQFLDMVLTISE